MNDQVNTVANGNTTSADPSILRVAGFTVYGRMVEWVVLQPQVP